MINEISRKIERLANEYQVSASMVDKILEIIESKIKKHKIQAFFVSKRELSYKEEDTDTPVQIDIMTEKYFLEISFGNKKIFYDITKMEDMGIIQMEIFSKAVKLKFRMKHNQVTKIITQSPEEFENLKNFASIYEKIIFNI